MAFVTATTLAQLHDGTVLKLNVAGHQLLVFREGANISAVSARCTHLNIALPTTHQAGIVTCNFHGAQFNLTTGACVSPALSKDWQHSTPLGVGRIAAALIPKKTSGDLQSYPVRVLENDVQVDLD